MTEIEEASRTVAPRLGEHLHVLVDGLLACDGLLLALDFDGTLAPIAEQPAEASMPPATRCVLASLAETDRVAVAVVSGRALADLRERVGLDDVAYAGNHGLELARGEETHVHPAAEDARPVIERCCDRFEATFADVPGVIIERKGVTATVHYRQAADADVPHIEETVEEVVDAHEAVRSTAGKAIVEIRPTVDWNKGDAVEWLRERCIPPGEDWFTTYVGDDTTDEDAFRVLDDGLGVKVGDHGTAAGYRLDDPANVRSLLAWLTAHGVSFLEHDHLETTRRVPS